MVQAHPIQRNQSSLATENPLFTIRLRRPNAIVGEFFRGSRSSMGQNWGHYLNLKKISKNIRCSASMSGRSAGSLLSPSDHNSWPPSHDKSWCCERKFKRSLVLRKRLKRLTGPIKLAYCQLADPLPIVPAVGNQKKTERCNSQSVTYSLGPHADDSSPRADNPCRRIQFRTGLAKRFRFQSL
jgi:hypothetical protein